MSSTTNNLYYYINSDGLPESVDMITGEIFLQDIPIGRTEEYEIVQMHGRKCWVPRTVNLPDVVRPVQFSEILGDTICEKIIAGASIAKAISSSGVTPYTFVKWRRSNHKFNQNISDAIEARGEFAFDMLIDIAEDTAADRDEIALGKLKAEIYAKVAAVTNEKYNPKQRIDGNLSVGVISLDTGIRRQGDVGYTEKDVSRSVAEGSSALIQEKED